LCPGLYEFNKSLLVPKLHNRITTPHEKRKLWSLKFRVESLVRVFAASLVN
jgi:hypothetical protein